MTSFWITLPPWLFAVAVTLFGRWGDRRFFLRAEMTEHDSTSSGAWVTAGTILFANLFFLSLIPTIVLAMFQPMLPFVGAQAGLALAIAVVFFGLVPARLLDGPYHGWDRAFWLIFIDFIRVGGALMLIGWLLNR